MEKNSKYGLTEKIIGAAIEVHRHLGPGLLESIYEEALCIELSLRGVSFERQKEVKVYYKDQILKGQRLDLVVYTSVFKIEIVLLFYKVFKQYFTSVLNHYEYRRKCCH